MFVELAAAAVGDLAIWSLDRVDREPPRLGHLAARHDQVAL